MGLAEARDHVVVPAFRIGKFLAYERYPTEAAFESSKKIIIRQIAFEAHSLLAILVEQKHSGSPHGVKAMEPCWMFLDVSFYRNEVLENKLGGLIIFIRFGVQPSASRSGRRSAEVEQNGPFFFFGFS